MGIRCSWPINKYSPNKNELCIDISNAPISQELNNNKRILSINKEKAIIKIQKFYRRYITHKYAVNILKYSSTGETKASIVKVKQNSIEDNLLNELFKELPPLKDDIPLIQVKTYSPGIGEYSGEWNDKTKQRHGRGIQVWTDKTIYIGFWKEYIANGKGKLLYQNGNYYDGNFVNGKFEGKGMYNILNGPSYNGEWKNDGKEVWPDETEYEGDFVKGIKTGKGELILNSDSYYKGDFYMNQIHGIGIFVWKNQNRYEGEWSYNKMNGDGVFYFQDVKDIM